MKKQVFLLPLCGLFSVLTSQLIAQSVGIGTTTPIYRLHVNGDTTTNDLYNVYSIINYTGMFDKRAYFGRSTPLGGYGIGGEFIGGYRGVLAIGEGGSYVGSAYGLIGSATGTAGIRGGLYGTASGGSVNYGVYGLVSGGANNYAIYGVNGNLAGYAGFFSGRGHFTEELRADRNLVVDDTTWTRRVFNQSGILEIRSLGDVEIMIDRTNNGSLFGFFEIFNGAGNHIFSVNELGTSRTFANHLVDGSVGIGTLSPLDKLHIFGGNGRIEGIDAYLNFYGTSGPDNENGIRFYRDGGIFDGGLFYESAADLLNITGSANIAGLIQDFANHRTGIGTLTPATKLHIVGGGDVSPTGLGYLQLGLTTGSNMILDDNEILARVNGVASTLYLQHDDGDLLLCGLEQGSVGIGITAAASIPAGYLLAVDGRIISEELRIQNSSLWPDYVFAQDYPLMPLDDLKKAIQEQKHLPNIPPAVEVEAEGFLVGDMQARMMEKIEELTLYVLELHEANKLQQKELESLKAELKKVSHER